MISRRSQPMIFFLHFTVNFILFVSEDLVLDSYIYLLISKTKTSISLLICKAKILISLIYPSITFHRQ